LPVGTGQPPLPRWPSQTLLSPLELIGKTNHRAVGQRRAGDLRLQSATEILYRAIFALLLVITTLRTLLSPLFPWKR